MDEPWTKWIPGVLSPNQMTELCRIGLLTGHGPLDTVLDNSSIDLSISGEAYEMIHGSVKPSASYPSYAWFIKNENLARELPPARDGTFLLNARKTYVFKLNEKLNTKGIVAAGFYGQATAKSSIGRVDVLVRLIVDGMHTYECFEPKNLKNRTGEMYLEITPITFHVKVKHGTYLSQLRLFYGKPQAVTIKGRGLFRTALQGTRKPDGSLTVDLTNLEEGQQPVAAFCAIANTPEDPIPLWEEPREEDKPKAWKHWKLKEADGKNRLKVEEPQFYLLRSKERIAVPGGVAIYCRASDETIGEMRIHYAGFVHPLWGKRRGDGTLGTPLMYEVRGHQVDVILADGEKLANLTFYRMSEDVPEPEQEVTRSDVPIVKTTPYEKQRLQLSKIFSKWPGKLRRNSDDTVEPA
jgi:dCTP deaminase